MISVQLFTEFQTSFLISIKYAYFKNDVTEIQWIFGLRFFQISDLTFVPSEFKIFFLQCIIVVVCYII